MLIFLKTVFFGSKKGAGCIPGLVLDSRFDFRDCFNDLLYILGGFLGGGGGGPIFLLTGGGVLLITGNASFRSDDGVRFYLDLCIC